MFFFRRSADGVFYTSEGKCVRRRRKTYNFINTTEASRHKEKNNTKGALQLGGRNKKLQGRAKRNYKYLQSNKPAHSPPLPPCCKKATGVPLERRTNPPDDARPQKGSKATARAGTRKAGNNVKSEKHLRNDEMYLRHLLYSSIKFFPI